MADFARKIKDTPVKKQIDHLRNAYKAGKIRTGDLQVIYKTLIDRENSLADKFLAGLASIRAPAIFTKLLLVHCRERKMTLNSENWRDIHPQYLKLYLEIVQRQLSNSEVLDIIEDHVTYEEWPEVTTLAIEFDVAEAAEA